MLITSRNINRSSKFFHC